MYNLKHGVGGLAADVGSLISSKGEVVREKT